VDYVIIDMEIYRIYNKINKKIYIGMTKWTFNKRYFPGKMVELIDLEERE